MMMKLSKLVACGLLLSIAVVEAVRNPLASGSEDHVKNNSRNYRSQATMMANIRAMATSLTDLSSGKNLKNSSRHNTTRHVRHVNNASAVPVEANFPKLPTVASIMGDSFEILGSNLAKEADKLQEKIHRMKAEPGGGEMVHMVAKKKIELELKLKTQEEANRKVAAANSKFSVAIATLTKQNNALKARAKGLLDGNTKIQKELHGMQSSLGVAAKDFTEAAGDGEEEQPKPKEKEHEQPKNSSSLIQESQQGEAQEQQQAQGQQEEDEQPAQEAPPAPDQSSQQWDEEEYSSDHDEDQTYSFLSMASKKMLEDNGDGAAAFADSLAKAASDADDQAGLAHDGGEADGAPAEHPHHSSKVKESKGKTVRSKPIAKGGKHLRSKHIDASKPFLAQGLAKEIEDLSKQVKELGELEAANDQKLETDFHTLFEAGKRRQKKLNKESKDLADKKKELTALHAQLSESVLHLENIHTKLEKQLEKVGDSLRRIEKLTQSL